MDGKSEGSSKCGSKKKGGCRTLLSFKERRESKDGKEKRVAKVGEKDDVRDADARQSNSVVERNDEQTGKKVKRRRTWKGQREVSEQGKRRGNQGRLEESWNEAQGGGC